MVLTVSCCVPLLGMDTDYNFYIIKNFKTFEQQRNIWEKNLPV